MKWKKMIMAGSVLSASLLLAACNKAVDSEKEKDGDITTLTFFSADLTKDDKFDNPVAKEITKKTGVKLEISHPVGGDTQAVPLMIASGDYPDLIFGKGDLNKLIDAGAVIPLDELIEDKGDNLKALYGDQLVRLKNNTEDPQIYHVGTGGMTNTVLNPSGTFKIQLEVLKELGYPEIKTLEDYENALKAYKEKYPQINGQDTIGLSLLGSDWRWLITVGNPAGYASGYQDDGQWLVDESTGETRYKFQDEKVKEYFKWLNHMYDEGLVDPESFTQKYDTYIAKISSGRVIGLADQNWDINDGIAALKADGQSWRTYAPLPVTLEEGILQPDTKDYGYTGTVGVSISSTSKQQEKAFGFLDWMASEEAQILVNWGIEGENYEIKDGKRVATDIKESQTDPNYSLKTGVGNYIYPFPQWGTGAVDSTGQPISRSDTKELAMSNYTEEEKEVISSYGHEVWAVFFPSPDELGQTKHGRAYEIAIPASSDLTVIQQKADDYTTQAITDIIISPPSEFEQKWSEMQTKLKEMGIDKASSDMTGLVKDRMELWEN